MRGTQAPSLLTPSLRDPNATSLSSPTSSSFSYSDPRMAPGGLHTILDYELDQILQFLDGFDLAQLWKTGDRDLQARFARPNVIVNFDIVYKYQKRHLWPRLLSRFQPRRVSITMPYREQFLIIDVDITTIPKSVESLKLSFPNDLQSLVKLLPNHPVGMRPNLDVERELLPLAELLPNLKSLIIEGVSGPLPMKMESLKNLPRSLVVFHCVKYITFTAKNIKDLPRTLVDLKITLNPAMGDLDASIFPPSLAKLHLLGYSGAKDFFRHLPRTLEDLTVERTGAGRYLLEDWKCLPPHLTSLNVASNFTVEWALAVFKPTSDSVEDTYAPRALDTLLHLHIGAVTKFEIEALALLPRGLLTFNAVHHGSSSKRQEEGASERNRQLWSLLPPSLENVSIGRLRVPFSQCALLPRNIKTFQFDRYSFMEPNQPETTLISRSSFVDDLRDLPALTSLVILHPFLVNAPMVPCLPKTLTRAIFELAPDGISETCAALKTLPWLNTLHLNLSEGELPAEALHALPSTIRNLTCQATLSIVKADLTLPWTRALQRLTITRPRPSVIPWHQETFNHASQEESDRFFRTLPVGLKELTMDNLLLKLPPSRLPSSLEVLSLCFSEQATDAFFQELPRSLASLHISAPSSNMRLETLEELPAGLNNVSLPYQENIHLNGYRYFLVMRGLGFLHFTDDPATLSTDVVSGTPFGVRLTAQSFPNNLRALKDCPDWAKAALDST